MNANSFVFQVIKHYYRFKNVAQKSIGTDVFALDILRGRDHGLAPYVKYLELCTNETIGNWNDLKRYVDAEVNLLKFQSFVIWTIQNFDSIHFHRT